MRNCCTAISAFEGNMNSWSNKMLLNTFNRFTVNLFLLLHLFFWNMDVLTNQTFIFLSYFPLEHEFLSLWISYIFLPCHYVFQVIECLCYSFSTISSWMLASQLIKCSYFSFPFSFENVGFIYLNSFFLLPCLPPFPSSFWMCMGGLVRMHWRFGVYTGMYCWGSECAPCLQLRVSFAAKSWNRDGKSCSGSGWIQVRNVLHTVPMKELALCVPSFLSLVVSVAFVCLRLE